MTQEEYYTLSDISGQITGDALRVRSPRGRRVPGEGGWPVVRAQQAVACRALWLAHVAGARLAVACQARLAPGVRSVYNARARIADFGRLQHQLDARAVAHSSAALIVGRSSRRSSA